MRWTGLLGAVMIVYAILLLPSGAHALHISLRNVRVHHGLWMPIKPDGWLAFVKNPQEPFGFGEEITGWINALGQLFPGAHDHHYGEHAEFDFVVDWLVPGAPDNHNLLIDWLVWSEGTTAKPEDHPTHAHSGLPELKNTDWEGKFKGVDVFSINSPEEGDLRLHGALDYHILGWDGTVLRRPTLTDVWLPGWTLAALWDDYVARWVWRTPQTHVFIFAAGHALGHDNFAQIDAVKAHNATIPEPAVMVLFLTGLGGLLAYCATRRSNAVQTLSSVGR